MSKADSPQGPLRDRPATVEVTPAMIDAGVLAFMVAYDPEAEGIDNLRSAIAAVLDAGINSVDHLAHRTRSRTGEFG